MPMSVSEGYSFRQFFPFCGEILPKRTTHILHFISLLWVFFLIEPVVPFWRKEDLCPVCLALIPLFWISRSHFRWYTHPVSQLFHAGVCQVLDILNILAGQSTLLVSKFCSPSLMEQVSLTEAWTDYIFISMLPKNIIKWSIVIHFNFSSVIMEVDQELNMKSNFKV